MLLIAVSTVLTTAIVLKAVATVNAIRWMHDRGEAFTVARTRRETAIGRPLTRFEFEELYDAHGAGIFPFGVKDYRLRRRYRRRGRVARRGTVPVRLAHLLLFRLNYLIPIISVQMVVVSHAAGAAPSWQARTHDVVAQALGLGTMVCLILIVVESVYSYIMLGGYGAVFHARRSVHVGRHAVIREFQVLVGVVFVAAIAGMAIVYFVSVRLDGFAKMTGQPSNAGDIALRLLDCGYFTLASMLGFDDATPTNPQAKIIIGAVAVQGFALLLGSLTSMITLVAPIATRDGDVIAQPADDRKRDEPAVAPAQAPAAPSRGRTSLLAGGAVATAALAVWWLRRRRSPNGE